jgi:hypothetical protein
LDGEPVTLVVPCAKDQLEVREAVRTKEKQIAPKRVDILAFEYALRRSVVTAAEAHAQLTTVAQAIDQKTQRNDRQEPSMKPAGVSAAFSTLMFKCNTRKVALNHLAKITEYGL